jgi:TrmH family RNA methyltransferase
MKGPPESAREGRIVPVLPRSARGPGGTPARRRLEGSAAILAALAAGETVATVFLKAKAPPEAVRAADEARGRGAAVHVVGPSVLRRFGRGGAAVEVLGVAGPSPAADLGGLLARGGAVWLLVGLAYPTNVGFALRTAEVSGADGVVVDSAFSAADRRTALRASMRADRVFPVLWTSAARVLDAARAAGARVIAVEDVGTHAPWEVDLARPTLFVVGGERDGVPADVLARCDEVVRVPMAGFIPSYNVQAAMAAVAGERLRQVAV